MAAMSGPGSDPIRAYLPMWDRSLRARGLTNPTVATYARSVDLFARWIDDNPDIPQAAAELRRPHIEAYLAWLRETSSRRVAGTGGQQVTGGLSPATVRQHYGGLLQFFKYLVEEDELEANPMHRMKAPQVPDQPVDVLSDAEITALLTVTAGKGFEERRDHAMLRLFLDTGIRLGELAGLTVEDVDRDTSTVFVLGKGRRHRAVPYGAKAAQALDWYLRVRSRAEHADLPDLWLGRKGPMTPSGVAQVLKRRSAEAGIGHVHPHRFRHTFAHLWMAGGGNEGDLIRLAGWKDRQMVHRYGASAADGRAREAHKLYGPGDRYQWKARRCNCDATPGVVANAKLGELMDVPHDQVIQLLADRDPITDGVDGPSRLEDQLADEVAGVEPRLRLGNRRERVGGGDERRDPPSDGDVRQLGEHRRRVHRGTEHRALLEVETAEVDRHHRSCDGARCDESAPIPQPVDQPCELIAADHVDHGIDGRHCADVVDVAHRHLGDTEACDQFGMLGAGPRHDLAITVHEQLDRRHADPTRRTGDQHPLARGAVGAADHPECGAVRRREA